MQTLYKLLNLKALILRNVINHLFSLSKVVKMQCIVKCSNADFHVWNMLQKQPSMRFNCYKPPNEKTNKYERVKVKFDTGRSARTLCTALQAALVAPIATAFMDTSMRKKNNGNIGGRTCKNFEHRNTKVCFRISKEYKRPRQ